MRMALVHDQLLSLGGSERVFQYMCETFPDAPAYTLAYNPRTTVPYFRDRGVHTTWLDPFVRTPTAFRNAFPIATYVMERLNLREYDLVLSSSATVAKYVRAPVGKHICYCYTPTRAIWQADTFFAGGLKSAVFRAVLPYLRRRDFAAAQRCDRFIAISNMSRAQIRAAYHRDADVLPCPVELHRFAPGAVRGSHFLLISRLESWKRLDYAIEAFTRLGLPLRVVGGGEEEANLRSMAGPNIEFLGALDDAGVAREYGQAAAVIFPPYLEYGLVPLEASASGTPVIAYGIGGITETMIPWAPDRPVDSDAPTALFFFEQTAESLMEAVRQFDPAMFDEAALIRHAQRWGVPEFRRRLRELVEASA